MKRKNAGKRGSETPSPPQHQPFSYRDKRCPVCKTGTLKRVERNGTIQWRCSEPGCANS